MIIILILAIIVAAVVEIRILYNAGSGGDRRSFWLMIKAYICFIISLVCLFLAPHIMVQADYVPIDSVWLCIAIAILTILVSIGLLITSFVFVAISWNSTSGDKLSVILFSLLHIGAVIIIYVFAIVFSLYSLGGPFN